MHIKVVNMEAVVVMTSRYATIQTSNAATSWLLSDKDFLITDVCSTHTHHTHYMSVPHWHTQSSSDPQKDGNGCSSRNAVYWGGPAQRAECVLATGVSLLACNWWMRVCACVCARAILCALYMHIFTFVCVCVCEREREREFVIHIPFAADDTCNKLSSYSMYMYLPHMEH